METVNPTETVTCKATARSGERCKRRPIPGGTVCAMHGGKAPQVQEKAKERLLAAADPAARRLIGLMRQKDNEQVALRAAMDILDRAGLQAIAKIEAEVTLEVKSPRELLAQRLKQLADRKALPAGEVVEPSP